MISVRDPVISVRDPVISVRDPVFCDDSCVGPVVYPCPDPCSVDDESKHDNRPWSAELHGSWSVEGDLFRWVGQLELQYDCISLRL